MDTETIAYAIQLGHNTGHSLIESIYTTCKTESFLRQLNDKICSLFIYTIFFQIIFCLNPYHEKCNKHDFSDYCYGSIQNVEF